MERYKLDAITQKSSQIIQLLLGNTTRLVPIDSFHPIDIQHKIHADINIMKVINQNNGVPVTT